uniref:Uncharacterized protein LOC114327050 n=1 Tax=Diabrotica virgifera virgifera TaxID=50390 RepID=A0A6P7F9A6_DIAVI
MNINVNFVWIPSHIGIAGNQEVDSLAKLAVLSTEAVEIRSIPHLDVEPVIKNLVINAWRTKWNQSTSKLREVKHSILPWKSTPNKRLHQIILSRLRIGQTAITHEHLLESEVKLQCYVCDIVLNVRPILLECPLYCMERLQYKLQDTLQAILSDGTDMNNLTSYLYSIN